MAQDYDKLIKRLNDLIALDRDAVEAYAAAISHLKEMELREALTGFQGDHRRHIRELSEAVTRLGGEPRLNTDVKGFFIKGFTAITSVMGDEAALRAMRGNETLTTRTYTQALHETWPSDVEALIERNRADEQRHLAFIEDALKVRKWRSQEKHPVQP